jgi:hypothetical protein
LLFANSFEEFRSSANLPVFWRVVAQPPVSFPEVVDNYRAAIAVAALWISANGKRIHMNNINEVSQGSTL